MRTTRKPQAFVDVLMAAKGSAVSDAAIAHAMWGKYPPADTYHVLASYAAKLRRLGFPIIRARNFGYYLADNAPRAAVPGGEAAREGGEVSDGPSGLAAQPFAQSIHAQQHGGTAP